MHVSRKRPSPWGCRHAQELILRAEAKTSPIMTPRCAWAASSGILFVDLHPHLAAPLACAAHVEFWRKSSAGRYPRFWCNERTNPGSISLVSPPVQYEPFAVSCKDRTDH